MKNIFTKKSLKKFILYTTVAIVLAFLLFWVDMFYPNIGSAFDGKMQDFMFKVRGKVEDSKNVVIVDIDEKSIKQLGQWPWSRDKIAKILNNLTKAGVGIIGFDVVFAEEDRSSPARILRELNITSVNALDYDQIFAQTVANTPTILGYQFELEDKKFVIKDDLDIPAIFIERNKPDNMDTVINAKGTILNNKLLQESAYSSGFFNNVPDDGGVVRSVPLIIRYNDSLYPSLILEMVRASMGISKVFVNYSELGVENIQIGEFKIPTDRYGRLIINYRGPSKTFKYISAVDIYNNNFNKSDIEGKIVIIGTSAAGLLDLRATPFESVYPGVEVHANGIDNIITQDFIYTPSWIDGINFVVILSISIFVVLLSTYTPFWFNPIILFGTGFGIFIFAYKLLFEYGIEIDLFLPMMSVLFGAIVSTFMDYMFEVKNEKLIKKKFASKVSKEVMESLLKDPTSNAFAAMEKEITVTFSDVRGFTNISEAMPSAKVLIEFLNEYMDPMTETIIKYKGTVDKFIGDAIMAYWNAPSDVKDHASMAVDATLEQLHQLDDLNEKIRKDKRFQAVVEMSDRKNIPIIDIGIGINTGVAIVGEMGSSKRSDYTAIGDSVNLGSRLESLCKFYNSKCNISNFTKAQIDESRYIFRFLDLVTVKGKSEPVEIWQIHDYDRDESYHKLYKVSKKRLLEELELYHSAVALYKEAKFSEALKIFKDMDSWEDKTNKNIYKIYIERCEHYIKEPPKDFNGVFVHTTKG